MSGKQEERVREVGPGEEKEGRGNRASDDEGTQAEQQGSSSGAQGEDAQPDEPPPPPTAVEWGVRGLSVLLLLALIGIVIQGALQPRVPVLFDVDVKQDQIRVAGEEWVVPVEVQNLGSDSIRDLTITAQLLDENDNVVDEADLVFPLLGYGESMPLDVWFSEDPGLYELHFDIGSYKFP